MKNRSIIRSEINNYYRAKVISWLASHVKDKREVPEDFPTHLYLGAPTKDEDVYENKEAFLSFCNEWNRPLPAGHIEFLDKTYDDIGSVKVPIHLVFDTPDELATWAGHLVEYHSAVRCLDLIAQEIPDLIDSALNVIDALANLPWIDFERVVAVSKWFCEHRDSEFLVRQIPIRGVDTTWCEKHCHLILDFLRDYLELNPYRKDLLQLGIVPPPVLVRLVIFDEELRAKVGGLRIIASSIKLEGKFFKIIIFFIFSLSIVILLYKLIYIEIISIYYCFIPSLFNIVVYIILMIFLLIFSICSKVT